MPRAVPSNINVRCSHARRAAVVTALATGVVAGMSGSAQSIAQARRDAHDALLRISARPIASGLRVYVPESPAPIHRDLPPNLTVSSLLRPVAELMLRHSPTFRRQCSRVAAASRLTVTVGTFYMRPTESARARTRFHSRDGDIRAEVEIAMLNDYVELIGHEMEHVIEQLDGIDLSTQASLRGTGALLCADGSFETVRAVRAGQAAASEVQRAR